MHPFPQGHLERVRGDVATPQVDALADTAREVPGG